MLHKLLFKHIYNSGCSSSIRNSALFINGAKATETFTHITPHIDFPEQIKQKPVILEQLLKRNCTVNFEKVENLWKIYEELNSRKESLGKKQEEISKQLGPFIKENSDSEEVNKLKMQAGLFKNEMRKLKEPLWSAEEAAVVEVLKLPNLLHPFTPDQNAKVLFTYLTPPKLEKDHLLIGKDKNLLQFKENDNYYLIGDAAIFELGAEFHFNSLLKKQEFIQFSNPDFVKSLIVEGCGDDHRDPNATFILHHNEESKANPDNRLHLTGGGSLQSFFAYLAKTVVTPKAFPVKYFTMGRKYSPLLSDEVSLFQVTQTSVVQVFGATKTSDDLDKLLHEMTEFLKTSYSQLGYHFRITYQPAPKLLMWESLRLSLEMYSTSLKSYVEVANLSLAGDYLSKRLMFTYLEDKKNKYPFVMSGKVLDVPKFLGCVLEQDSDFSLPKPFEVESWF